MTIEHENSGMTNNETLLLPPRMKKLRIGVLGAGHLGKIHIKLIKEIPEYELIGHFDPNKENSREAAEKFGSTPFASIDELIDEVDVVDVVTPTLNHFECAEKAVRSSKHLFIEKPITNTLDEARSLRRLAEEANVKVQVGHVERFNPAFMKARPNLNQPMFIESHRLAEFNPRGTDVSVVLDLMIHDIDLILSVVRSNVKKISASGVAVVSEQPDIANARIEFDNGCVANLTASRISMKNMRKSRFFQRDAYIAVDMLEKEVEIVTMTSVDEPDPFAVNLELGNGKGYKQISFDKPEIEPNNAIKDELASLAACILNDGTPAVTVEDGYLALDVAYKIIEQFRTSSLLSEQ